MKVLIFLLIFYAQFGTKSMTGRVVSVADGDTFTILLDGNIQERIRLADIDAPEYGQDFGNVSRKYLSDMIADKTVQVEWEERDIYGRILGYVFIDGINVNYYMVENGVAWIYYYSQNEVVAQLQEKAKQQKLNIWSMPNPIDPYHYRRGKR